jgi:hypothetical protein
LHSNCYAGSQTAHTADEEEVLGSDHKVSSAVGKELGLMWKRDTLKYSNILNSSSLRAYTVENG